MISIKLDIVDIKPANMEELTEVITAAEFHPLQCNLFMYSSSKGTIKLADMRESALCDQRAKGISQQRSACIGICTNISWKCLRWRRIRTADHFSLRSFPPYPMSNLVETDDTSYPATI